jgi:hypothetical protein
VPPDVPLTTTRGADWPDGTRAFAEMVELAALLRTLLANARPAAPADLGRPSDPNTRLPSRDDLALTLQRARLAQGALRAAATELEMCLAGEPVDEEALWAAVETTAAYGVATPIAAGEQLTLLATAALSEANRRADAAEAHLKSVQDALAAPDAPATRSRARSAIVAAGQVLFGDGFWIVPEFEPPAQPDLLQAALAPGALAVPPGQIRRFLADIAAVREPIKRVSEALLLTEALGFPGTLRVAQLAPAGAVGAGRWIGGPLDPDAPAPQEPVSNLVLDAPAGFDGTGPAVALVVDQWTDVVPLRERRGSEADAPIDERATSGIAFNAMAPSARAPQTMLLAVAPGTDRWTTGMLTQTLLETLDLAKLRLVTLERTNGIGRVLPAMYTQSWSLQGEPALNFKALVGVEYATSAVAAYIKD